MEQRVAGMQCSYGFSCMGLLYPFSRPRGPPHANWGEPKGSETFLMRTKVTEEVSARRPPHTNWGETPGEATLLMRTKGLGLIPLLARAVPYLLRSSRAPMGTVPGYEPFGHQHPPTGTLSCGLCNKVLGGWGSAGARVVF